MSNYTETIAQFLAGRLAFGDGTAPLNLFIAARVADAVDPGQLRVVQDRIFYRNHVFSGMTDLYQTLSIPGARIREVTAPASLDTFVVDCSSPPKALRVDFVLEDIAHLIGSVNVQFLDTLHGIWADRLALTGLWDSEQIRKAALVCSIGGVCFPENQSTMQSLFPKLGSDLWHPAFKTEKDQEAYRKVVELLRPVIVDYVNRQYTIAAQAAKDAADNAEFWNTVYEIDEALRDAPFTAVEYGLKGLMVGLGWKNITLLAVVGIAVGAWYTGAVPAILKSIKAKAP